MTNALRRVSFGEQSLPVHSLNTLVIGSGAAARILATIAEIRPRWSADFQGHHN